jgi:hypothetical protein
MRMATAAQTLAGTVIAAVLGGDCHDGRPDPDDSHYLLVLMVLLLGAFLGALIVRRKVNR